MSPLRATNRRESGCAAFPPIRARPVWEQRVIVLHGFAKKSGKTPDHELDTAKRRLTIVVRNTP